MVSIVLHPFVTGILLAAGVGLRTRSLRQTAGIVMVGMAAMVPIGVLMLRQVRSGRWDNADASNARERPILFATAAVTMLALVAWQLHRGADTLLMRGAMGTLSIVVASAAVTPWVKASLHMAFGVLATTVLVLTGSPIGAVLLVLLPLLAWSRLQLSRHTPVEIGLGGAIGFASGCAMWWL